MTPPEANDEDGGKKSRSFWPLLVRFLFKSPGRRTGDHINQKAAWVLIVGFVFQGCHQCGAYIDDQQDRSERVADLQEQRANYKELVKAINDQADATRDLVGQVTSALDALALAHSPTQSQAQQKGSAK